MADFILKNNYFEFNEQISNKFLVALLVPSLAPRYACLFMYKIETAFLETQELQPWVWFRYIDSIFLFGHMVSKTSNFFE